MEPHFYPRLSEASQLLPLISDHIVAASSARPLGTDLELCPIVEDGLFGYEILPKGNADTYLIIGRNSLGGPALRTTSYNVEESGPQLIAVDGRVLSRQERAARYHFQSRDASLRDWLAAADAACAHLNRLFPPRIAVNLVLAPSRKHRYLEEAVCVTHYHLTRWDPSIAFFGLPNQDQMGYPLTDANGNRGELVFQRPDTWKLRWTAAATVVEESWSIKDTASLTAMEPGQLPPRDRRMHRRRKSDGDGAPRSLDKRRKRGRRTMDLCNL